MRAAIVTLALALALGLSGPAYAAPDLDVLTPNAPLVAEVQARWDWLHLDVTVVSVSCGYDNAYYLPSDQIIVMCDDLYDRPELASWVLAHELGHAFMFQRGVPQRRGTLDQERVADEMAFLMSTVEESVAAAKWFLESVDADGVHPPDLDRAASLLCLISGREGEERMCRLYYDSMLAHWVRILDGYNPAEPDPA